MKPGRDIAVLAVLLGLVIVAGIFLWGGQRPRIQEEISPTRSSYSSRPGGTKALYLTLSELGYRVRRHRSDLSHLPKGGILFLVEPLLPVAQSEWEGLKAWVEQGNFVCAFLERGLPLSVAEWIGPEDPLEAPAQANSSPIQPSFLAREGLSLRIRSRVRLWLGQPVEEEKEDQPSIPSPFLSDRPSPLSRIASAATPLYADAKGTTLAYSRLGAGGALLCSSPWSVSNEGLAKSHNIEVVVAALHAFSPQKERAILFDEYHHGYEERRSLLSLLPPLAKVGLLQAAIAAGMLLFSLGRRFGAPVAPEERKRVRGEYLSSMSLLLRRGGAIDLVAQKLRDQFRKDLARAAGLRPDAAEEEAAARVEAAAGVAKERVLRVFSRCARLESDYQRLMNRGGRHFVSIGQREEETRLLALAKEMREVIAECRRRR